MSRRRGVLTAILLAGMVFLAGCTQSTGLQQTFKGGTGYVSGDGVYTEITKANRKDPITFSGPTATGTTFDSAKYTGKVVVVNFWYASCPPCRLEAKNVEAIAKKYAGADVEFVGVNTRDQSPQIERYDTKFGVTYPSIIDVDDANVQLAFSGSIAPNSTPTTIVLDKRHRVAVRVLGAITDKSILNQLVRQTLDE
jgi:thiol-disulfide isomerase/thioredoxin